MNRSALVLPLLACAAAGCSSSVSPPPDAPPPPLTRVVPHRGVRFDPAKENAVWCATIEMAWQALGRDVLKGAPLLGPAAPPEFVAGMNARPYPADAVDAASCIAVAGRSADGILDRIAKEGREKFDVVLPRNPISLDRPDDILAYAFLRKDLPFAHPFETVEKGITFPGIDGRLPAWGLNPGDRIGADAVRSQARLLFRTPEGQPDAFALEFRPKKEGDRILLALLPGAPSLEEAWKAAAAGTAAGQARALAHDAVLSVPRIRMALLREFQEIAGAPVTNPGFTDFRVLGAFQSIDFRLDETGAVLESEAALRLTKSVAAPVRERPDVFVFDRPFLVALIRDGAKEPYFLAWIANGELLAK